MKLLWSLFAFSLAQVRFKKTLTSLKTMSFLRNTKILRSSRIMTILETRKKETKTTTVTTVLTAERTLTEVLMEIRILWFVFLFNEILIGNSRFLGGIGIFIFFWGEGKNRI